MRIDIDSFATGFPKNVPPPVVLLEFGKWLKEVPHGTLGYFDAFRSTPLDAAYASHDGATAALRAKLGIFLELPDGSRLAMWEHGGQTPAVVLLGSEGDLENVATSIEGFLLALARGRTGVGDLDNAKASSSRAALGRWLEERKVVASHGTAPPFREWFDRTVREAKSATPSAMQPERRPAPADLIARVDALIGKFIDDSAVIELTKELGFDLPSIQDPAVLRKLAQPHEGYLLEIAWPWDFPNKGLASQFPPEKRESMKARMLWGIEVHPSYKARDHKRKIDVVYGGFKGALPFGLSFADEIDAAKRKIEAVAALRYHDETSLVVYDAKRDTTVTVDFADEDEDAFEPGAMMRVRVRRRSGFEP